MSAFKFAVGHDNEAGLEEPPYPPATDGIEVPERRFGGGGAVFPDGDPFIRLTYGPEITAAQYVELLTFYGLYTPGDPPTIVDYLECTVQAPLEDRTTWVVRNGVIVKPEVGRDLKYRFFWRGAVFTVKDLKEPA